MSGSETDQKGAVLSRWGKPGRPPPSAAGTYLTTKQRAELGLVRESSHSRAPTSNRGGQFQKVIDPPARAAARAIYESKPGMTCALVAAEMGGKVAVGTLYRWKAEDGWKSAQRTVPDLAGRAGQLANTFKVKMSELGKPLDDEVAAAEVAKELAVQEAVNVRANVLDRHRKEWGAPRKLIYEAVQKRDLELAKLAKIAGETLQIVQAGECRSYGLDHASRAADGGTVIVVQREGESVPAVTGPATAADVSSGADDDGGF